MSESFRQYFDDNVDGIKIISKCPVCGAKFYSAQTRILEERETGHCVHIECRQCKAGIIALIYSNGIGVSSVSLVTDLGSNDVVRFTQQEPVGIDDVIQLHEKLRNNDFFQNLHI